MIPSLARVIAASCASTLTACALWWGGGNGVVEISHAVDGTPNSYSNSKSNVATTLGLVLSGDGGGDTPIIGRLQPCPYESNCVSSNYLEPPNRYVSPLKTFRDRETAFARAVRDLQDAEASSSPSVGSASTTDTRVVEILPRQYYIHATVPGTAANSLDDVEILFATGDEDNSESGGIVHLRCQSRVNLPPPPFCLKKNCINGNMDQRNRVEQIARTLGLPAADQERMQQSAKWTPIFFNSDRVPGFDDEI